MPDDPTYDELKKRAESPEQTLEVRDGVAEFGPSADDLELQDLLDIPLLYSILDSLYGATGLPSAVLDLNENVLIAIGWQEICTCFHRVHPEAARRCRESDAYIKHHLAETGFVEYRCANGLWDFAFPIRIDGRHLATFFFGQVLLEEEPIDRDAFRQQARNFGFNEARYMAALDRVPVISREKLNHTLSFSEKLARLVVNMGSKALSQARSISQRDRAQAEMRESENKFRSLFEQAGDAIFIHDPKGRYVEVNQKACDYTGYTREELLNLTAADLDPDYLQREDNNRFWDRFRRVGKLAFEARLRRKDGTLFPVEVALSPMAYGNQSYVLAIVRDITERKRLEEQLRQAQKMEAIGALAGGVAHDFNNILAPIIGYTEMTIDAFPDNQQLCRNLNKVLNSAQRARDLVNQILTFSRKAGKSLRPIRLRPIIKEALKLMRATIPTTIDIQQDIADTGSIMADLTQIHQIVVNLCTNAYHAMWDAGGILRVELTETEIEPEPAPIHPLAAPGRYVRLTIGDTGGGIDPVILQNIFEPYFTTKGAEKGTGLGLAVVDGIVRYHGGFITVDNHPGEGCAFHVFFPLVTARSPSAETKTNTRHSPPTGTERLMLVDDEPPVLEMLRQMLEGLGYTVVVRDNSPDALALFASQPGAFDLVLTDMTMPTMTGDRLAKEIKAIRPDIPVILCTGYSDKIDDRKVDQSAFSAFLMKPMSRGELAAAVRKALHP